MSAHSVKTNSLMKLRHIYECDAHDYTTQNKLLAIKNNCDVDCVWQKVALTQAAKTSLYSS